MPTDLGQATGLEREELDAAVQGEERFFDKLVYGPFGTAAAPCIVPSSEPTRIVGCIGDAGKEHPMEWMELGQDSNVACGTCNQVFALDFKPRDH